MGAATLACGNDEGASGGSGKPATVEVPKTYGFPSRFSDGDSVNYAGQVGRQVLVADLATYIEGLTEAIDSGSYTPSKGTTLAALNSYYEGGTTALSSERLTMSTTPPAQQQTYGEISSAKNLKGKIAGNDAGQHKDWTVEFSGFSDQTLARYGGSTSSPDGLVQAMFATLDQNAVDHVNAVQRVGPTGETLEVHQTANGIDLHELVQKFLLGAVNFSQATDDYLDEGLTSDNTVAAEGEPATELEHGWDEGFGYFGAARDYADYTDEEIAGRGGRAGWSSGYHDSNSSATIDLKSEYNFSVAGYAAKRDLGAVVPTNLTGDAFTAFVKGRAIISTARGALSEAQLAELKAQRDIIVLAWEKALSATAVHYLNEVLVDMQSFGLSDYAFGSHAGHWSEMKGFALGLQFNPFSPLSDADFARFHELVGDAPVLPTAESGQIDAYKQNLLAARAILQKAYAFDPANMGDDNGQNGW
jgi:hypothetical protein